MSETKLNGETILLEGSLLKQADILPDFTLLDGDTNIVTLQNFLGKKKIIYTVPSLDTSVCIASAKKLNELAMKHPDLLVMVISVDTPFAMKRVLGYEGIENIIPLSIPPQSNFAKLYGVRMKTGPIAGYCARCVIHVDEGDRVQFCDLIEEVTDEPNFDEILKKVYG
ncbi:MAG: Thiol peroxidase [Chlamydiia bacterium]|nr:Thiol peroxidase [Chlamydiia bacterium]